MGTENYNRGRNREHYICKKLRKQDFDIVQRSAGSHSPIDVWAIDIKNKIIKLIQVKPREHSKFQTNKILEENKDLNGEFEVIFEVV